MLYEFRIDGKKIASSCRRHCLLTIYLKSFLSNISTKFRLFLRNILAFGVFSPSHIEGSSTSVGRPRHCQSPVLAVENVAVSPFFLMSLLMVSMHLISVVLAVSHLLPPCPALFWWYGINLYFWHVHTSVVVSASGVLLSAERLPLP